MITVEQASGTIVLWIILYEQTQILCYTKANVFAQKIRINLWLLLLT